MNTNDTGLTVRAVTEHDYDQWLPLWDGYNRFYGRFDDTALPMRVTQLTWSRFFDGYEPVHALVAERAGRLVGLVHFLYHRSTTHIGPTCYLQDLFTLDSERGKGIGRALIAHAERALAARGCLKINLQVLPGNDDACRFYAALGYRVEERISFGKTLPAA